MPNTKEKLIEILAGCDCNDEYCKDCEFCDDLDGCVRRQKEIIADHLIANGVTVQECDDRTVILPKHGYVFKATFSSGDVIGDLRIGEKTYRVYLGDMEAHQLGCAVESYDGIQHITPGMIKRKFVLIEV